MTAYIEALYVFDDQKYVQLFSRLKNSLPKQTVHT